MGLNKCHGWGILFRRGVKEISAGLARRPYMVCKTGAAGSTAPTLAKNARMGHPVHSSFLRDLGHPAVGESKVLPGVHRG